MKNLPDYVVANYHKKYTGVSATVKHLLPIQQQELSIAVLDSGHLGLKNTWKLWQVIRLGWTKPKDNPYRIFHARRDVEMILGLFLKYVLRQPWRIVFTSAAPKKHSWLLNSIIKKMDGIIATSKRSAGFLEWHSTIIHHGVDTELFKPHEKTTNEPLWVGAFGRLRPSKGTDLLIQALIELLPQYGKWSAFFTGLSKDKSYLAGIKDKVNKAGLGERILFLGDLTNEQIYQYYQKCTLVAACSRREGFGLTPLEAMASGVAVITSGAGFWPELIAPDHNGQMFETGQIDDLVKVMRSMINDPEKLTKMGSYARKYVVENHSIQKEASQINAFYQQLANEKT